MQSIQEVLDDVQSTEKKLKRRVVTLEQEKEDKIILSIALLVSNRKDTIQKCLDSLTPIREAIPSELIVLDTGCDADLRALLDRYADKIENFTWIKDFSAARNVTLQMAEGEWYMYLDDDEWFVETDDLIEFFRSGDYKNHGYANYIQRNYLDMQGSQWTDAWVARMIKRTPELHFESKIHEYMTPMSGNCRALHSYVDHYGYVFESEEKLIQHYERNSTLLKEMIEAEPTNLRWRIHLAQEYRTMCMWHELYDMGTECLSLVEGRDEMYSNIYLGTFYACRIVAMREQGLEAWKNARKDEMKYYYEEGIRLCEEALKDRRNTNLFKALCELRMTWFTYWLGRYDEALEHGSKYLDWLAYYEENEPLLFLHKSAPIVCDSFDEVMKKEVYSILMCVGLRKGSVAYLKEFFDKLEWTGHHLYVFEDMIPTLIEAMDHIEANEETEVVFGHVLKTIQNHGPLCEYYNQELQQAEMRKLGKQVKEQLRVLINAGMKEQAKAIIGQVKQMLPGDEELEEMENSIS